MRSDSIENGAPGRSPFHRSLTPTILAGASGEYRELRPSAALEAHFQCVWFNAFSRESSGHLAVVPDGCVDIMWIDGEMIVAGPDVVVNVAPLTPGATVIGMRFRPGAASRWLGLPMSEIVDGRVPLREFWGAQTKEIASRVSDAATNAERMTVLEESLRRLATKHDAPPADMGFVFNALKTESAGPGMRVILDRLHVSPRTLRRRCVEAFGYGPKTLDRILRFQRLLKLARKPNAPPLAGLAFVAGYADQAHMTREVRRLSGYTPGELLSQLLGSR